MEQLVKQDSGYRFLPKADIDDIGEWIVGIYQDAMETMEIYELYTEAEYATYRMDYVPTLYMVLDTAYGRFDEYFYHYVLNGHHPDALAAVNRLKKMGLDEDMIITSFAEERGQGAQPTPPPEDSAQGEFNYDVKKALNDFQLPYYNETFSYHIDFYHSVQRSSFEMTNPPVKDVW